MGWETRRNGRQYFYRKQRQGGRVVSEYVGAGLEGQLRAMFAEEDQQARAQQRAERSLERAQDARARQVMTQLDCLVREAVAAALRAAGYHQHRGQWRLKRMSASKAVITQDDATRMTALYRRIDAGKAKPEELAEFRGYLETHPNVWRVFGDLCPQAERVLMTSYKVRDSTKEALIIGLRQMREELGFDAAPLAEKMVIQQVVLSWLRLSLVESQEASAVGTASVASNTYWDKALSAAQRRHLRAIETLARVRRLMRPLVQVNVATDGGQQVNVAGNVTTGHSTAPASHSTE